ncbi:hypothetical protein DTX80_17835 [Bacilli bacterium]|nr:hypothetical protein WH51_11525 [Bacilli bacterium VT-13-104]PZD83156.1 hypothetical protein DEJ64_15920 [Bacilli bacterium]PZD84299.1 hypothetical protein DEJ60_15095 [Bacilli bacterium]PZD86311.1 hypothetical protein DEJ66_15740 [Bacilli bacterium]RCO04311.1 hypothetical protein DTX80_17835 [Bacilli bacterium]
MKYFLKFFIVIISLLLEMVVIQVSHLLPFIGENKSTLNLEMLKGEALFVLQHPIDTISSLVSDNNPLFYIGTIAVIIYTIVVFVKNPDKKGWEAEIENTTHGGARYARTNEIFIPNQIKGFSKKQLLEEFKNSLGGK